MFYSSLEDRLGVEKVARASRVSLNEEEEYDLENIVVYMNDIDIRDNSL